MQHNKMSYLALMISVITLFLTSFAATADTAAEIDRDVDNAIQKLYAGSTAAKELSRVAKATLVFPKIIKGGLITARAHCASVVRLTVTTARLQPHTASRPVRSPLVMPCFS
jgi:lipid-binding SYLF domain-containing protein